MENFKDYLKQLRELRKEIEKLISKGVTESNVERLNEIRDSYTDIKFEVNELYKAQKINKDQIYEFNKETKNLDKNFEKVFFGLKNDGDKLTEIFDKFFEEIQSGLDSTLDGIEDLGTAFGSFSKVLFNAGENLKFWREYDARIRDVAVSYGLSTERVEEFRNSNRLLEKEIVALGGDYTDLQSGIKGLYDETSRSYQITEDFAGALIGMKTAFGVTATEGGKILGTFQDLNISFGKTQEILTDLYNSASKAGLSTKKIFDTFTSSFKDLNTFSFKNGVQGMMEMVKQSTALKVNMDRVLQLSDDFTDPEKTMEFASNMQLLGGSFAQLGDFNKLMYDAAVSPEEFTKNIAKATAGMGSFNKETGNLDLSFVDRMQLGEAAKQLGMTKKELMEISTQQAKISSLKMELNMKPLSEDAYNALSTMAEFDTTRGEYVVKFKDEQGKEVTKSVAELSPEDIDKISKGREIESLKSLAAQRMDVVDATITTLRAEKFDMPNLPKTLGLVGDKGNEVTQSFLDLQKSIGNIGDLIKTGVFNPFEDFVGKFTKEKLKENVKGLTDLINEIENFPDEKIRKIRFGEPEKSTTEEDKKTTTKLSEGGLLKGLSHEQGGIPFTIGGKSGFEAEGGEVLLTKGVSSDPKLLSAASEINEAAGGKKLYADGGIIKDTKKINDKINFTNIFDLTEMNKMLEESNKKELDSFEKMFNDMRSTYERFFSIVNQKENVITDTIKTFENNKIILNKEFVENNKTEQYFSGLDELKNLTKELNLTFNDKIDLFVKATKNKNLDEITTKTFTNSINERVNKEDNYKFEKIEKNKSFNLGEFSFNLKDFSFEPFLNELKNLKKEKVLDGSTTTNFSNIDKLSNYTLGKVEQGGLIDKKRDVSLNNITMNGNVNVGGKIDFGTIKVTVEGTTKEIASSDSMKKEIFNHVEKMINSKNKNLYVTQLIQKNTGIDSGKKQIIHGITDVGDSGAASWFS